MSVQLALLKSNEEVIADIKEYRDSEDNLVSYLFKDPYIVKVKTSQVLVEEKGTPKHEVVYYKWMSLSKDEAFRVLTFLDECGVLDTDHTLPEQGEDFDWCSEKYHLAGSYDELSMEMS